jgi:WD40 repeat protein
VSFHPDGSRLVSCSFDGQVKVWDWKAGVELLTLPTRVAASSGTPCSVPTEDDRGQPVAMVW